VYTFGPHYEVVVDDPGPAQTTTEDRYIHLDGVRIAHLRDGALQYLHHNHLGTATLITAASGEVVDFRTYLPFGAEVDDANGDVAGHRYGFTGAEELHDLYALGVREYSPESGRMNSPDTVIPDPLNPQSFNRYAYAYNNPVRYTDRSGYEPVAAEPPIPDVLGELSSQDPSPGNDPGLDLVLGPWPGVATSVLAAGLLREYAKSNGTFVTWSGRTVWPFPVTADMPAGPVFYAKDLAARQLVGYSLEMTPEGAYLDKLSAQGVKVNWDAPSASAAFRAGARGHSMTHIQFGPDRPGSTYNRIEKPSYAFGRTFGSGIRFVGGVAGLLGFVSQVLWVNDYMSGRVDLPGGPLTTEIDGKSYVLTSGPCYGQCL